MDTVIFKDGTSLEIKEGANIGTIVVAVSDFAALETIAETLTKQGNLDEVRFASDEKVTGVYIDMTMETPLFVAVDIINDGTVQATFGIRPKTAVELRLEVLESVQK